MPATTETYYEMNSIHTRKPDKNKIKYEFHRYHTDTHIITTDTDRVTA